MPSGKLLGFIVSYRGIEANPEKLKDMFRMNSLTALKDVHKLTGCMAALSRFVSRLRERAMPFYKLLKKQDKFQWTSEVQQAFEELKEFLTNPHVLVPPMPEELLLLYIQQLLMWSARPLSLSDRRKATPRRFYAQSTSSARF